MPHHAQGPDRAIQAYRSVPHAALVILDFEIRRLVIRLRLSPSRKRAPRLWIPACAGMTGGVDSRLRGNDLCGAGMTVGWIPACAGMTGGRNPCDTGTALPSTAPAPIRLPPFSLPLAVPVTPAEAGVQRVDSRLRGNDLCGAGMTVGWIPAYAGMRGGGGTDGGRKNWIPACAGMTDMG